MIPSALVGMSLSDLISCLWHFLGQLSAHILSSSQPHSKSYKCECMCMSLKGQKGWGKLKAFKYY